jgi:hypothetical protein
MMLRHLHIARWRVPQPLKGLWVASVVLCVPNLYDWGKGVHSLFCKLRKTQGIIAAQDLFKAAHWVATKRFLGDPVSRDWASARRVPLDRYGIPLYLPLGLRSRLRCENPNRLDRAIALFLLSLFKCYTSKRPPSYAQVTAPGHPEVGIDKEYRRRLPALCLMLGLTEPLRLGQPKLFATNRGGPNGHALLAAHLDAVALEKSKDTGQWFHKWAREVFPKTGTVLSRTVQSLASLTLDLGLVPEVPLYLGKIGLKPEASKTRIFAISDYWTQVVLRPLHDALMEQLRGLPTDATWNQDGGAIDIQKWSAEGREMWSFDLTGATDRFPRTLQASLLDHLLRGYGPGYGQVWSLLLTNREYKATGPKGQPLMLRYAIGQPMGTLSSWAAFALTHHTVVQWAALNAGRQTVFTDYRLLGDDIVIADGEVAEAYEALMSLLDVGINRSKSVHAVGGAEFAKRSFAGGTELTGLHWNLFGLASSSKVHFYANCVELQRRGYDMDWTGILQAVVGPARDRKVSKGVRSLLLSLAEMAGPVEDPNVWWALRFASTSKEVWADSESAIDERVLRAATHCLGLRSLKAERLLSAGRDLIDTIGDQLDTILLAQLEDAVARHRVSTLSHRMITGDLVEETKRLIRLVPNYRLRMNDLLRAHPARVVAGRQIDAPAWTPDPTDLEEFLIRRYALQLAPYQLRVLSKSDTEQLMTTRDIVQNAYNRMQACAMRWAMGSFES